MFMAKVVTLFFIQILILIKKERLIASRLDESSPKKLILEKKIIITYLY